MTLHEQLFLALKVLTEHKDRHIKGHSTALLKRLQEFNPQDESKSWCDECQMDIEKDYKNNCLVCGNQIN